MVVSWAEDMQHVEDPADQVDKEAGKRGLVVVLGGQRRGEGEGNRSAIWALDMDVDVDIVTNGFSLLF